MRFYIDAPVGKVSEGARLLEKYVFEQPIQGYGIAHGVAYGKDRADWVVWRNKGSYAARYYGGEK